MYTTEGLEQIGVWCQRAASFAAKPFVCAWDYLVVLPALLLWHEIWWRRHYSEMCTPLAWNCTEESCAKLGEALIYRGPREMVMGCSDHVEGLYSQWSGAYPWRFRRFEHYRRQAETTRG